MKPVLTEQPPQPPSTAGRIVRSIVESLAPGTLALLLPFIACRAAILERACVYNPSLGPSLSWHSAPALFADDALFALLGACIVALVGMGRKRGRLRAAVQRGAQCLLLSAATLLALTQYLVYAEIGLFPSITVFGRFLTPGGQFFSTAASLMNFQTLGLMAACIGYPFAVLKIVQRHRRTSAALTVAAALLLIAGLFWPVDPPVAAIAAHPFRELVPADFERPTPADPEVSPVPSEFRSISGDARRDDCASRVRRADCASLVVVVLESTADQYLFSDGDWLYPSLRRMAAGGLRFPHYYSGAGRSNPAVYSLLSGRYLNPHDAWWDTAAELPRPSLPRLLKQHGYQSGFFLSGCFRFFFDGPLFRGLGWDLCQDGDDLASLYDIPDHQREGQGGCIDDAVLIDHALRWIEGRLAPVARPPSAGPANVAQPPSAVEPIRAPDPFLCVIYTGIPHTPYQFHADGPYSIHHGDELPPLQRYENQLAYVLVQIGRLYNELAARGFFDHGFLVITGDHGEAFGQHPGNFVHGLELYNENVRVPLLVVNPQHVEPGECRTPGAHVDFSPTLLDLVGLAPDPDMQGVSLLAAEGPEMVFLVSALDAPKLGLVDGPHKFIHHTDSRASNLFDLARDPGETHELAAAQPDLVRRYRSWVKTFVHHELTPPTLRDASPAEREYNEGRRLRRVGRPSAAADHFRRALQLRPDDAAAREQLGWCYYDIGRDRMRYSRWKSAAEQFAEAMRLLPDEPKVRTAYQETLDRAERRDPPLGRSTTSN